MPWCKECEAEYEAGFDRCPICHSRLADQRPQTENEAPELAFLVKTESAQQLDFLRAALLEAGIPSVCSESGPGQVVRIMTGLVANQGADLYVAARDLPRAIHVVQSVNALDLPPFEEAALEAAYDDYMKNTPRPPIPPEAFEAPPEPASANRPERSTARTGLWIVWCLLVVAAAILLLTRQF